MRRTSPDTSNDIATPRTTLHRHLAGGVARLGAAAALLTLLLALPVAVLALVGVPQRGALADAFGTGRLNDTAIVQIGTLLFLLLWAWFAATAVGEVVRVAAWRSRPRAAPLQPLSASPTGVIRRLVRVAMISSSAVVGTGLVALIGTSSVARVDAAAVTPQTQAQGSLQSVHPMAPNTLQATGRDTPYSIAVRLGDPSLRDRIIELNRGTVTPNGAWSSGVFPAGMSITVPVGSLDRQQRTWTTYTVVPGDSVYRIAGRLSAGEGARVRQVADEIIGRNIGRVMNDGALFDDPSLIKPGWQIEVPTEASPVVATALNEVGATSIDPLLHTVVPGESYWSIAEDHLHETGQPADGPEILALTDDLIEINQSLLGHSSETLIVPGDQLQWPPIEVIVPMASPLADVPIADVPMPAPVPVPVAVPVAVPVIESQPPAVVASDAPVLPAVTDTPTVATDTGAPRGAPLTTSLGAAVLLCAGALGLVESRRRHQLRRAPTGARLEPPTDRDIATERLLRTLPATQRALRLDLALRSAGHHLAGSGAHVLAATMTDTGTIALILHRPGRATPASPWQADVTQPARWVLDAMVDTDELVESARLAGQPCPALVHLGTLIVETDTPPGTALFVDLEAFGLFSVDAGDDPHSAKDIVRALAASLAASPVGETLRMVTHELDIQTHLGNLNAESAETIDAAIDCAAAALGSTPTAIGGRRTFELRARGVGGEAWEPVVIMSGATIHDVAAVHDLVAVSRGGGRGLAAVLIGPIDGAELTLTAAPDGWTVAPLDLRIVPVGLPAEDIAAVHDLLDGADRPLAAHAEMPLQRHVGDETFVEAPWQLVVRVLGQVVVTDRAGIAVGFDRGKALELAAWLSLHRERPTRAGARTALWDLQVRDATFANVVSDARRAMGRAVSPPTHEEWIERTLTEQLPLHALVTSDAELLRARLDASRGLSALEAIDILRPGVEWIVDMPFAGTGYLWPDAEGITSSLTLLATAAATELARHCLSIGDVDGVFWATGRGLQVLSGHEELIGLRMRAYAQRGDLAGVRSEWEVYERAIHSDPWSSGEPSPKLVAIRRELLSH